ncbi:hypothetical protein D3C77_260650 [compost metagenome]
MNTLKDVLLRAVSVLPSYACIQQKIIGKTMSLTQTIIAAIYKIAEEDNFYAAEQPKLIEKIMGVAELHTDLPEDTVRAIRSRLGSMPSLLQKLGVQFSMQPGDWGLCSVRMIKS